MSFLRKVLETKEKEIADRMKALPLDDLKKRGDETPIRSFSDALAGGGRIIAEIKKRSPKVDRFRQAAFTDDLATLYERSGAAAVSVVADAANFGMSLDDARRVREQISLPVLVKDFYFDPYQIHEARASGADAVLLISRILTGERLGSLLVLAGELGMEALVEVHSEADLEKAEDAGARIIGINNRDLDSLEVSLDTTRHLAGRVKGSPLVVSESGIRHRSDIEELSALGVGAFLIGGVLLESVDPATTLRSLLGHTTSGKKVD